MLCLTATFVSYTDFDPHFSLPSAAFGECWLLVELILLSDCADVVSFSMVLKRDGHEIDVLHIKCPGRKPLIEEVRPRLEARRDGRSVVHLHAGSVAKADGSVVKVVWSSPAELFAVSESFVKVVVEILIISSLTQPNLSKFDSKLRSSSRLPVSDVSNLTHFSLVCPKVPK